MVRTWEEAAREAATELYEYDAWMQPTSLEEASEQLEEIEGFGCGAFADIFHFALGYVGEDEWPEDVIERVVRTIISKQNDYGHGNILRHGLKGIGVRMDDKIARIGNLESRDIAAQNESLSDSYLDLMGYSIIGWMFVKGTFTLPLEKDLKPKPIAEFDTVRLVDVIVQMLASTIEHVVLAFEESEKLDV